MPKFLFDYFNTIFIYCGNKCIVFELIGEWNDAIENDIMTLKREVIDIFESNGISKFIIVAENVLNFHSGDKDYYEEWYEEIMDEKGWVVILNMPVPSQYEFKKSHIDRYIELMEIDDWRIYKPFHLFKKIDSEISTRLLNR